MRFYFLTWFTRCAYLGLVNRTRGDMTDNLPKPISAQLGAVERHVVTDRESWLALRMHDVTASDVAAVFGLNPYKTPMALWAEKTGVGTDTVETSAMRRGRWMEDAVIAACRDHHPDWSLYKPGLYLRAPSVRVGATPDAVEAGSNLIVQCKTVASSVFKSWGGEVPVHYQMQALTEAMLWGASSSLLAVLVVSPFGAEYHEYDIPRHPAAEARVLSGVSKFWADIEAGVTPKPDYKQDGDILASLYAPSASTKPLDLSTDNYFGTLLSNHLRLSAEKRKIEDALNASKAEIVEKLAGSVVATAPGYYVTNKVQHRKSYVVKDSSFAVLRVTETEQKEVMQ